LVDATGHQGKPKHKPATKDGDEMGGDGCPGDCGTPTGVIAVVTVTALPEAIPQPVPTPTPAPPSEPFLRFMTRREREEERRAYHQAGPGYGAAYDFWHSPAAIFFALPGFGENQEEPPIFEDMVDETGVSIENASTASTFEDVLMPGGQVIGRAGSDESIRELEGGIAEGQAFFKNLVDLAGGGEPVMNTYKGQLVRTPDGGTIGFRTFMTKSPSTAATIDVQNVRGITITLKFNPKQ